MAIIFKPKTRVKKLQYGGSVPVYADFTPSDASQQVYNPISLLKKYGSDTPKAASPAKAASTALPKESSKGLTNDNAEFYTNYNNLKSMYETGVRSNEYWAETQEGKQVKSALDRYTTLGVQAKKNREDLYNKAVTSVNSSETGSNWMYSGGFGMMRRFNPDTNKTEYESRVSLKNLPKFEKDGWQKMKVSEYMHAASNSPEFAGENKLLHTVQNIVNENDVLSALDAEFNDIGVKNNNSSTTYGNVSATSINPKFSAGNLKKYVYDKNNTTNRAGLNQAFDNIMFNLTPAQQDAIKSSVIQNTNARTNKEITAETHNYIAREMLKRVDEDFAKSSEMIYDEAEEEEENSFKGVAHVIKSGGIGGILAETLGVTNNKDTSVEVIGEEEDGLDNITYTFRGKGHDAPNLTKKLIEESSNPSYKVNSDNTKIIYNLETAVITNSPDINVNDVKVKINDVQTEFLESAVYTDDNHEIVRVPTMNNSKIISFSVKELEDLQAYLKKNNQSTVIASNRTPAMTAEWEKRNRLLTNKFFAHKTGGAKNKMTMRKAARFNVVVERESLKEGKEKTPGLNEKVLKKSGEIKSSSYIKRFDDRNEIDYYSDNVAKDLATLPITALIRDISSSKFIIGEKVDLSNTKLNLTDLINFEKESQTTMDVYTYLKGLKRSVN
mgnify:FL=1